MNTKDIIFYIISALAIAMMGIFLVNQALIYYYHVQFIAGPCQVCAAENQEFKQCLATTPSTTSSAYLNITSYSYTTNRVSVGGD